MTFVASRQQFDRCECCGRRFPARALDMDRRQLWRSDMLGMDPATHSYLAGADFHEEVDWHLETAWALHSTSLALLAGRRLPASQPGIAERLMEQALKRRRAP